MGTDLMAIPYPKQRTGTGSTRPSSARGVVKPVYPANDRYFADGRPSARPAPKAIFDPNPFQKPAVSYGRPLAARGAVNTALGAVADTALGGISSLANRLAFPFAAAGLAKSFYDAGAGWLTSPTWFRKRGWNGVHSLYPSSGLWEKRYGNFTNYDGYPYSPNWRAANTWHERISGQAMSATVTYFDWNTAGNSYGMWFRNTHATVVRYAHFASYFRVASKLLATNGQYVFPLAPAHPWAPYDPLLGAGGRAASRPPPFVMLPYIGHNPYRSPVEQTQRGPRPLPRAAPTWSPAFGGPIMGTVGWNVGVGLPALPTYTAKPTPPGKPGNKTRESKWTPTSGATVGSTVLRAVGMVTEGLDFAGALWSALPKSQRTGYYPLHYRDKKTGDIKVYYKYRHKASVQDKLKDLVRGFDDIDVSKAISAVIDENIEDALYGGVGRATQKARQRGFYNESKRVNEARAKYGRRYRGLTGRRDYDEWVDLGPKGRGYQTGNGYRPDSGPYLENGPSFQF